jgi:hypothetical protein
MRINYNATGTTRKALVKVIADMTGEKPRYMKLPTYNYEIGPFTVTRDGALEYDDSTDAEAALSAIKAAGFSGEAAPAPEEAKAEEAEQEPAGKEKLNEEAEAGDSAPKETEPDGQNEETAAILENDSDEATGLTVEIPLDKVAVGNLTNILEAKGTLIRHALGIDDLRFEIKEDRVAFPWFSEMPEPENIQAYTHFIAALCKLSKDLKRTSNTETPVTNEKYAFRCFLLRLGFIGKDYKAERKILLKNLSGNSSWKNGAPKKDDAKASEAESTEALENEEVQA